MAPHAMNRPCLPSQHRWRLAECLPLTLPDTSGWVRVLLQRVCRVCGADEVWAGRAHHSVFLEKKNYG